MRRSFCLVAIAAACALVATSCEPSLVKSPSTKIVEAIVPALGNDMRMSSRLTYSAFSIFRETSARLFILNKDLKFVGSALESYYQVSDGARYVLKLNSQYRSVLGEPITAEDVAETFRFYVAENPDTSGFLKNVNGYETCRKQAEACKSLTGVRVLSPYEVEVTLSKPDLLFTDQLTSVWMILFKKDRPHYLTVGECQYPYPTGRGQITACTRDQITVESPSIGKVLLRTVPSQKQNIVRKRLVNDNPGDVRLPSLTVLAAYSNPKNFTNKEDREIFYEQFRFHAKELSTQLRLSYAPTLAPRWMSVEPSSFLTNPKAPSGMPCKEPVVVLLDSSLPSHELLEQWFKTKFTCKIEVVHTTSDKYFAEFQKVDVGMAWFTPNFLYIHNIYGVFDCSGRGMCYFDWKDPKLQKLIDQIEVSRRHNQRDVVVAREIEDHLAKAGYAGSIADMVWWIVGPKDERSAVHSAGLAHLGVFDFLLE